MVHLNNSMFFLLLSELDYFVSGNTVFDQVLQVLFSTSTFVGGILAVVLDNIIPGKNQ